MSEKAFGLDCARVRGGDDAGARVAAEIARPDCAESDPIPTKTAAVPAGAIMPAATDAPFAAPPLSLEEKQARLISMNSVEVQPCTRCKLCETRTNTVFGEGEPGAAIFFIGEGPGEEEDLSGRPFVGRAGQLLNKMIAGMGIAREQVFIANIVKCRPPNNRVPAPDEVATCAPYLVRQLEIVRPRVIVTLGLSASQYMLGVKTPMGKLRGQWQNWRGIKLMPTYHPSFVLRAYTEENRAAVWSDLKAVMAEVGMEAPAVRVKKPPVVE